MEDVVRNGAFEKEFLIGGRYTMRQFQSCHCYRIMINPTVILIISILCGMIFNESASADTYIVGNKYNMGLVNDDGEILSPDYYIYETELSFVFSDSSGKWGYFDKQSGFLQLPMFDYVYDRFCTDPNSPILVENDQKIGYLDRKNGKVLIPFQYSYYTEYSEFCNGYAVVKKANPNIREDCSIVLIDKSGYEFKFPDGLIPVSYVYQDIVVILQKVKVSNYEWQHSYGLGKTDGSIYMLPCYDFISNFHEGYACVKKAGKWGHINVQGEEIVPPIYELAEEDCGSEGYFFDKGVAKLYLSNETIIYIDYYGNEVEIEDE